MKAILWGFMVLVSVSSAFAGAGQYVGKDNNQDVCYVTFEKIGKNAKIGLADARGNSGLRMTNKTIVSSDKRVVTYAVYNRTSVVMDVAYFSEQGLLVATKYPLRKNGYCTVKL